MKKSQRADLAIMEIRNVCIFDYNVMVFIHLDLHQAEEDRRGIEP